ncbi:hypothetical protein HCC36_10975 [Listeria booriae]|uniref:Uncharacterized protein n=1 Tax=Listeria booriae TaxID=1552123 RepID=A0A842FPT4_9LIST|nr:hypothetical protein [Listeria booriae]MBC2293751.1 hypothetical protein [Listeria booriae]
MENEEAKTIVINPNALDIVNSDINGDVARTTSIIVNGCKLGKGVLGFDLNGMDANEKLSIAIKYHDSMVTDEFREKILNADKNIYFSNQNQNDIAIAFQLLRG